MECNSWQIHINCSPQVGNIIIKPQVHTVYSESISRSTSPFIKLWLRLDRLCGLVLVAKVPGCRSRDHGFDSRSYQIFWLVVGLERSPLSLVNTIEEVLEGTSSGCGLESRECGRRDPSRWPSGTLYPQKLALTSTKSGGRSVLSQLNVI
jgi:hypothetical protein